MTLYCKPHPSPLGELTLICREQALVALLWEGEDPALFCAGPLECGKGLPLLISAAAELDAYFAGDKTPLCTPQYPIGSNFQKQVWQALGTIPHGQTRSYSKVACQIGNPRAVRAVGAAIGRNPLPIFTPCHRVIGSSGALTGFAGGLAAKEFLLRLEAQP